MFHIGPYRISSQVVLAPMAGVTDLPFRQLCRRLGAGLVVSEIQLMLSAHLCELHRFYGVFMNLRIARKHLGWYLKTLANAEPYRKQFNQLDNVEEQHASVQAYFEQLKTKEDQAA